MTILLLSISCLIAGFYVGFLAASLLAAAARPTPSAPEEPVRERRLTSRLAFAPRFAPREATLTALGVEANGLARTPTLGSSARAHEKPTRPDA